MKSLIVIIALVAGSWHYIDLSSESALESVIVPIILVLALIGFALWLVVVAGVKRRATVAERFGVD